MLYGYADLSTKDLAGDLPGKSGAMRDYAYSMMQTTQWLVEHDLLDGGAPKTELP